MHELPLNLVGQTPIRRRSNPLRDARDTALWRLINLQPAVWRGLVVAAVAIAGTVGLDVAVDLPDNIMLVIIGVLPVLQALYTRGAVTPNAKVVILAPDPVSAPNAIEAGPAAVNSPADEIIDAARSEGESA